MHIQTHRSLS